MKRFVLFPTFLFIVLILTGCSKTLKVPDYNGTIKHMIALNGNGRSFPLEPQDATHGTLSSHPETIEDHVGLIVENIKKERRANSNRNRILIYVHGGLNAIQGSVELAKDLIDNMKRPNERGDGQLYYPIIVNWESGAAAAYRDHIYRIRQGKEVPVWYGGLTAPFYFLADVGRALVRYPITIATQVYSGLSDTTVPTSAEVQTYNHLYFSPLPISDQILLGKENFEPFSDAWVEDRSTLFFPGILRLMTTPALEAFGKPGWDNMVRRTQTVFRTPDEFKSISTVPEKIEALFQSHPPIRTPRLKPGLKSQPTGGLSILMEGLRKLIQDLKADRNYDPKRDDYKITLVGHSMGTIIINELIRLYGDSIDCGDLQDEPCRNNPRRETKNNVFQIDEIVYLAAACTISDFQTSVIPHMQKNADARFYNVTLHPTADAREKNFYDLFPRGSLLEWIDDFARNPASFMELTMGKWNNAIMALHIVPEETRSRVTLKGFGIRDQKFNGEGNSSKPEAHGHLNDIDQSFWQPRYWTAPQ